MLDELKNEPYISIVEFLHLCRTGHICTNVQTLMSCRNVQDYTGSYSVQPCVAYDLAVCL